MSEGLSPQDMVSLGLAENDIAIDRLDAAVGRIEALSVKYEEKLREQRVLKDVLTAIRDGRSHTQLLLQLPVHWYGIIGDIDALVDEAQHRR